MPLTACKTYTGMQVVMAVKHELHGIAVLPVPFHKGKGTGMQKTCIHKHDCFDASTRF